MTPMNMIITENILRTGRHIVGVFDPHGKETSFCYSVGNTVDGLPEFLLIGNLPPSFCASIINMVSAVQNKAGAALGEGDLKLEDFPLPFRLRHCTDAAKGRYTVQAGEYFGRQDYKVIQIMLCDKQNRYPGDEGCEYPFNVDMP